jgi:hypothetical protein
MSNKEIKIWSWAPTNWPTDRRSQYNLTLNLHHCTANYRPVLLSKRAPTPTNLQLSKNDQRENEKNWLRVPDRCLTPRRTVRLTVGGNVTWLWIWSKLEWAVKHTGSKSQDKKPSFATIRKYALLHALHDHDMFRPS